MPVICQICERVYCHQRTLNAHLREKHQQKCEDPTSFEYETFSHKCLEGCNVSFNNIRALRYHLQNKHNIISNQESKEFSNVNGNVAYR